ncbi:MAG: hypothetical protein ACR2N6_07265 [Miltoncostaeaceae bacterium]
MFGGHPLRTLRGRKALALGAVGAVVLVWAPTVAAQWYDGGPGAASVSPLRPDQGWAFAAHSAWESRSPDLGSNRAARTRARRIWAGPPAVAERVELAYLDDGFAVPVPAGGAAPAPRRREAVPRSRLGWRVYGSVRGGPTQMIGLLDYPTGAVAWDIRPLPEKTR